MMHEHNNHVESRKHPRFVVVLPLEIISPDFHLETKTKNISCAGLFCEVDRYIPVDTEIEVTMKLSLTVDGRKIKKTVNCPASVVRIDPPHKYKNGNYNIGIAFLEIEDNDKVFLLKYIRQKNFKEAKELKKMYLELKSMAARLVEVEECHPTAEHFRKVIERAIAELDAVAHILDFEINELKNLE